LVGADTDGDGTIDATNRYDADGIRVAQAVNGLETRYLVDTVQPNPNVLLEYQPSAHVDVSYVYGHHLISQQRNALTGFYLLDGLGSTRALADSTGAVTDEYTYDAFGRLLARAG